jgi:hypothetical protein
MIHFRLRYERLRDRLRQVRRRSAFLRAAWLALLVPLVGLGLYLVGWGPLAPRAWLVGALVVGVAALAWQRRRAHVVNLGRLLDRRFGLDDLLITAVEVDQRGVRSPVELRLLDDAAIAVATLGGERAIDSRASRREAETVAALVLTLIGLWLLAGTIGRPLSMHRLPPLAALGAGQGDGLAGRGGGAGSAGGTSPVLAAMAGALADQAATRSMAGALAAGDPAGAASAARALADRTGELSDDGRRQVGASLQQAAQRAAPTDPEVARALIQAGQAMSQPNNEAAAARVEELAAALDAMVSQGRAGSGAAGESAPHTRSGPQADRLGADPTPVRFEARSTGSPLGTGRSAGGGARTGQPAPPALVEGGGGRSAAAGVGPDALRYPWERRDTVRRYFAPEVGLP